MRIIDREAYHYLDPQVFVAPTQVIPYSAALFLDLNVPSVIGQLRGDG